MPGLFATARQGPHRCGITQEEGEKAQRKYGVAQAGAEVLPEWRSRAGIVGGEEQSKHEDKAANAGGPDENAQNERKPDREFAVGDQERDRRRMRKDEVAQYRRHQRIGAALREKFVNPELKAAMQGKLCAEDFVLAEDEEEDANTDA